MMVRSRAWVWVVAVSALCVPKSMAGMLIATTLDATYDVDPATGRASNPRPLDGGTSAMVFADGVLYRTGASQFSNSDLLVVDVASGEGQLLGTITGIERSAPIRDLSWDTQSETLFGLVHRGGTRIDLLYTVNLTSLAATLVGELDAQYENIAIDHDGRLFAMNPVQGTLGIIDKASAATISQMSFSPDIYRRGEMEFSDAGELFAETLLDGRLVLLAIDPTDASVIPIGPTGLEMGFTSMAYIPEPGSVVLLFAGVCMCVARRMRIMVNCLDRSGNPWHGQLYELYVGGRRLRSSATGHNARF